MDQSLSPQTTPTTRQPRAEPAGSTIHKAPSGWARLAWLGPGFLWMVSAAGSGELLFTPRVGALYGYALVWALLAAVTLKWFINREVGRYTVCTGKTILEGFATLPGPRNWALWVILVPQVVVASATIAGLAGSAATALILVLPGAIEWWTIGALLTATAPVIWGRYKTIERVATLIAVALALAAIIAALTVGPNIGALVGGIVPQLPPQLDYAEILPWLGFMLSGAAGMIWYSYWVRAKGYGAASLENAQKDLLENEYNRKQLRGWLTQLSLDNTVAVVGTLIVTLAFLILGVELLRPEGLVPEGNQVASVLGRLLGEVWGPIGFWFMVVGVFVGFWDTVLSDQDGHGRTFANGTRLLASSLGLRGRWVNEVFLRRAFVLRLVTALPIAIYLIVGEPVGLLKLAGGIEAAHIPILAALALYLNRRLPVELRTSGVALVMTTLAALFFAGFALVYIFTLG